jgi:hypothetical protein
MVVGDETVPFAFAPKIEDAGRFIINRTEVGPTPMLTVAVVAELTPPGPVAVSVVVNLSVVIGDPVIAPVVVLNVAQLGRPVADQLVAGRFVESDNVGTLLYISPTYPDKVWLPTIIGAP